MRYFPSLQKKPGKIKVKPLVQELLYRVKEEDRLSLEKEREKAGRERLSRLKNLYQEMERAATQAMNRYKRFYLEESHRLDLKKWRSYVENSVFREKQAINSGIVTRMLACGV